MTLRDFGQSIITFWENYTNQITSQSILDWSIGNLLITLIVGSWILFVSGSFLWWCAVACWNFISDLWNNSIAFRMVDYIDKKFGYYVSGFLFVVLLIGVPIGLLAILGSS